MNQYKSFFLLPLFVFLSYSLLAAERGVIKGGVPHAVPDWFKESFLEIADDVEKAAAENKHVMLFFQLNDCPYCDRMLRECFEEESMKAIVQENFDVIAINVKGDRDVAFNESLSMTEKELSEKLNVRATPSILFLDHNNDLVVRVNGYRSPKRFRHILDYVSNNAYKDNLLSEYLEKNQKNDVYSLREHEQFQDINDLSSISEPLAVIFEDSSCYDCDEFHQRLLAHEEVEKELALFTIVRLDTDSEAQIIDVDGNPTTAREWANSLNLLYRPGVVLFDQGKEISRIESLLFSYHFKENLRYVGGGFYRDQDYSTYSEQRREELLSAGIDINLSE